MIISGGWSDNDTIGDLVDFLKDNKFCASYANCNFYELDKKYINSFVEDDYYKEYGIPKYEASKESINKEERFIELLHPDKILSEKEKYEFCDLLTQRWISYRKKNFNESENEIDNPNFKIHDSFIEEWHNYEMCFCFTKSGGQILIV